MGMASIFAVCTATSRTIRVKNRAQRTGIFKTPVPGRMQVDAGGLRGDTRVLGHGDLDRAVSSYCLGNYDFWRRELSFEDPLPPGSFGENLTLAEIRDDDLRMGDIARVGSCLLQVAQPRLPCRKLDARLGRKLAPRLLESCRTGCLYRVVEQGMLEAGDPFELVASDPESPTVAEFVRVSMVEYWNVEELRGLLRTRDLGDDWRNRIEQRIERALLTATWAGLRRFCITHRERAGTAVQVTLACAVGATVPVLEAGSRLMLDARIGREARRVRCSFPVVQAADPSGYVVTIPNPEADDASRHLASRPIGDIVRLSASGGRAA